MFAYMQILDDLIILLWTYIIGLVIAAVALLTRRRLLQFVGDGPSQKTENPSGSIRTRTGNTNAQGQSSRQSRQHAQDGAQPQSHVHEGRFGNPEGYRAASGDSHAVSRTMAWLRDQVEAAYSIAPSDHGEPTLVNPAAPRLLPGELPPSDDVLPLRSPPQRGFSLTNALGLIQLISRRSLPSPPLSALSILLPPPDRALSGLPRATSYHEHAADHGSAGPVASAPSDALRLDNVLDRPSGSFDASSSRWTLELESQPEGGLLHPEFPRSTDQPSTIPSPEYNSTTLPSIVISRHAIFPLSPTRDANASHNIESALLPPASSPPLLSPLQGLLFQVQNASFTQLQMPQSPPFVIPSVQSTETPVENPQPLFGGSQLHGSPTAMTDVGLPLPPIDSAMANVLDDPSETLHEAMDSDPSEIDCALLAGGTTYDTGSLRTALNVILDKGRIMTHARQVSNALYQELYRYVATNSQNLHPAQSLTISIDGNQDKQGAKALNRLHMELFDHIRTWEGLKSLKFVAPSDLAMEDRVKGEFFAGPQHRFPDLNQLEWTSGSEAFPKAWRTVLLASPLPALRSLRLNVPISNTECLSVIGNCPNLEQLLLDLSSRREAVGSDLKPSEQSDGDRLRTRLQSLEIVASTNVNTLLEAVAPRSGAQWHLRLTGNAVAGLQWCRPKPLSAEQTQIAHLYFLAHRDILQKIRPKFNELTLVPLVSSSSQL